MASPNNSAGIPTPARAYSRAPMQEVDPSGSPLPPMSGQVQDLNQRAQLIAPQDPARAQAFQRQALAAQARLQQAAEQDMQFRRYQRLREIQAQMAGQAQRTGQPLAPQLQIPGQQ